MGCVDRLFTFCPIEGDINGEFSVVTGMNIVSSCIPSGMNCVAVIHPDGDAAVGEFCVLYQAELSALLKGGEK